MITIHVTNLNNAGDGSLRAALESSGSRIVVFDVAGTIELTSDVTYRSTIKIDNPNVTVLGETAPNGGICVKGIIHINADEVILRHLRIRPGNGSYDPDNGDCITITNAHNVVISHCSLSWSTDELFNVWADNDSYGTVEDVTIEWCIFAWALKTSTHSEGDHSMGVFLGGGYWNRISFHHNIIAFCYDRTPQIASGEGTLGQFDFVNNLIYGCTETPWFWGYLQFNIVNNYIKYAASAPHSWDYKLYTNVSGAEVESLLYINGNVVSENSTERDPILREAPTLDPDAPPYPRSITRLDYPEISTFTAQSTYLSVLGNVGAFPRDAVDLQVINHIKNNTGSLIDDPAEVGGYPDLTI